MISVLSDFERIFPPNLHTIMLHLLIEVHRNISNLGPAFYYWEFVMERFLSTLSRKIHDRGHPEINLIRNHTLDLALQRLGSLFKEQLSKGLDSELTNAYFEAGPLQPAQPTPAVVFPYSRRSPRVNPPDTAILLLYEWLQDVYNPANGNASISIGSLKACTFRICIRGVTVNGFKRLTEDAGTPASRKPKSTFSWLGQERKSVFSVKNFFQVVSDSLPRDIQDMHFMLGRKFAVLDYRPDIGVHFIQTGHGSDAIMFATCLGQPIAHDGEIGRRFVMFPGDTLQLAVTTD
jgi:hypothetical protein